MKKKTLDRRVWRERLGERRKEEKEKKEEINHSTYRVMTAVIDECLTANITKHLLERTFLTHPPNVQMFFFMCLQLSFLCPYTHYRLITHHAYFTNQQSVGCMDGEAAGKGVVYGKSVHIGGLLVASPLVHIPAHVEMEGISAFFTLLTHILQLNMRQMHWWEVTKDLVAWKREKNERTKVEDKLKREVDFNITHMTAVSYHTPLK